ncbi:hypothetical protein COL75_16625 [Bacillus wiedmannii]|uniref:hypothetical protein n=1 Tax=Bacillus wiedmannii TaxID=1890302 RepID=UPI000BF64F13|nr:hypothetical protein [Bacillus wiedmannii]PFZ02335.1 hypothetical protein COL75_16625 [Bacillus wiedmannii]
MGKLLEVFNVYSEDPKDFNEELIATMLEINKRFDNDKIRIEKRYSYSVMPDRKVIQTLAILVRMK